MGIAPSSLEAPLAGSATDGNAGVDELAPFIQFNANGSTSGLGNPFMGIRTRAQDTSSEGGGTLAFPTTHSSEVSETASTASETTPTSSQSGATGLTFESSASGCLLGFGFWVCHMIWREFF